MSLWSSFHRAQKAYFWPSYQLFLNAQVCNLIFWNARQTDFPFCFLTTSTKFSFFITIPSPSLVELPPVLIPSEAAAGTCSFHLKTCFHKKLYWLRLSKASNAELVRLAIQGRSQIWIENMATCMAYGFDGFGISLGGIQSGIPLYRQGRKFGTIPMLRARGTRWIWDVNWIHSARIQHVCLNIK